MLRFYAVMLAFVMSISLFADDVTGFIALEYGGAQSSYQIKNVKHVDVNNISIFADLNRLKKTIWEFKVNLMPEIFKLSF